MSGASPARTGAAPARKGARFEVRVVADQQRLGRLAYRLRQGQGCPFDVAAIEHCSDGDCTVNGQRDSHTYLIQAKSARRGVSTAEAERMACEAARGGAGAVIATPDVGGGVIYRELAS